MIRVKVFNPAGATRGLPDYGISGKPSIVSDTFAIRESEIGTGVYKGETVNEALEGEISLYDAPYAAEISSRRIYLTEGGIETVQLYRESFDAPVRYGPYWDFDRFDRKVEAYADRGIEFEGNRYANAFTGGAGNDRLFGMAGDDHLSGSDGKDFLSGAAGMNELLSEH